MPGRMARGSLPRAATAQTTDGKTEQNAQRHSLDRLNAIRIKPKNLDRSVDPSSSDNCDLEAATKKTYEDTPPLLPTPPVLLRYHISPQ